MKKVLFWGLFPLTYVLLIVADLLSNLCEFYIDAFNSFEGWARFSSVAEVDEHAEVCKGHEGIYG